MVKDKIMDYIMATEYDSVPTLYIDMDGVMIDSTRVIVDCYNEDFNRCMSPHMIQTWGFKELKYAPEGYIYDIFKSQRFFDKVKFFDGCVEFLKGWNYLGHRCFIVTMGHPINLALKEEFTKEHVPFCYFIGVDTNKYKSKGHIKMSGENSFYIDDLAKNLRECVCENKIAFGVKKPWNETWNGDWVKDFKAVEKYFEKRGLM